MTNETWGALPLFCIIRSCLDPRRILHRHHLPHHFMIEMLRLKQVFVFKHWIVIEIKNRACQALPRFLQDLFISLGPGYSNAPSRPRSHMFKNLIGIILIKNL